MRFSPLIFIFLATQTLASEHQVWKTSGDWAILIRQSDDRACYANRTMDDGSEIQIGVASGRKGGYFAIYNAQWTHIEAGATGLVEFNFGDSRFGGDAIGKIENGIPGGYAFFDNPAFVEEFGKRQTVKIIGTRGAVFEMDLTGTKNAVAGVLACQAAQPEANDSD
jgi:hypothetical protein